MKCIQSPPEENEQACIYMQVNLKLTIKNQNVSQNLLDTYNTAFLKHYTASKLMGLISSVG